MFFTGIDWSQKHLDFCLKNNSDVIARGRVDNDDNGFSCLLQEFTQRNIAFHDIAVAIESPSQRIVDFLLGRGIAVYPVNPTAVYEYRKSRKISGSKSDTADAELIADYVREHYQHLRVWRLCEGELRQMKLMLDDLLPYTFFGPSGFLSPIIS